MVNIRPLTGGVAGLPNAPKPAIPTDSGLSRSVVFERDQGRNRRKQQESSEQEGGDQPPPEQRREYPVYNPHAGLTREEHTGAPIDVVA